MRRRGRRSARLGIRVLVVDDSRTIVAALTQMLVQNGFETLSAGDAEAGLDIALDDPPDLIFLDIVLPGMSGFAALRKLRRHPATKSVPVIMISSNPQTEGTFYLERVGADGFMKTPCRRDQSFAPIESTVSNGVSPARRFAFAAVGR